MSEESRKVIDDIGDKMGFTPQILETLHELRSTPDAIIRS